MFRKGIKYWIVFALSFLVMSFVSNSSFADLTVVSFLAKTPLGNITIGSLLVMGLNWLKIKAGVKIP